MKKNLFILSLAFFLPSALMAQVVEDDLYYIPSKKKQKVEQTVSVEADRVTVSAPRATTVVVRDTKKNVRDVDEYNRRYRARDYDFNASNDTLYIDERSDSRARYDDDLDGEWVHGEFDGSADDYEYATRIIRFRNPRYAISVSSPIYWDVVYGLNSWEWNVYTDGLYAYAFPTFSNRLWWDWRFNSWGWGWGAPYYSWGWNSWYGAHWSWGWGGWYDGWHGGWGHHHHHHHHHYNPGWAHGGHWGNAYTSRRPLSVARGDGYSYRGSAGTRNQVRRANATARQDVRRAQSGTTRRASVTRGSSGTIRRSGRVVTTDATRQHSTYSRPSSTRGTSTRSSGGNAVRSTRRSESTHSRGTSAGSGTTRSYNRRSESTSPRNYNNSSRSYSPSRSSSGSGYSTRSSSVGSSRSSGSYSGGGSSRSSGGGGGSRRR